MPTYKLTYFKARGRAEMSRQLFALAGVDYVDERLDQEEWAKLKPNTPFGKLPMLTVDGVQISQGNAIARLLAKRFGFAGVDDMEQAKVDMIMDTIDDMNKPLFTAMFETKDDPAKKAELMEKFAKETQPDYNSKFEKLVHKSGFFGEKITTADIAFAQAADFGKNNLDKFPKLKELKRKVETTPAIAAWVAKRPQTDF